MMCTKGFATVGVLLFILSLLFSCNSTHLAEPASGTEETDNTRTADVNQTVSIGRIHNEVLAAIHARHDLLGGEKIHVTEFVPLFIECMEEVYEKHEMTCNVTDEDVLEVLDLFADLRDRNIANFFEIPSELPVPLLEYLAEENIIQEESVHYYTNVLRDILNRAAHGMATDRKAIPCFHRCGGNTDQDDLFMELACCSAEFWTDLCASREEHPAYTSGDDKERELRKQRAIMTICWDALGGFLGGLLAGPPGAVVGAITASAAYIIFGS